MGSGGWVFFLPENLWDVSKLSRLLHSGRGSLAYPSVMLMKQDETLDALPIAVRRAADVAHSLGVSRSMVKGHPLESDKSVHRRLSDQANYLCEDHPLKERRRLTF